MTEASSQSAPAHRVRAHLMALAAVLIWSLNFPLVKVMRQDLGPVTLYLARFDMAALFVVLIWAWRRPRLPKLSMSHWGLILLLAALAGPTYQILLNLGAVGTSSGLIGLLIGSQPFHIAWLAPLLLGERFRPQQGLAILIAFIGVSLPILARGQISFEALSYPALVALAALIGAVSVIIPRGLRHRIGSWELSSLYFIFAAVISLPLITPGVIEQWQGMSGLGWLIVFQMAVPGQVLAAFAWFSALRNLPALTVTFYLFLMMLASGIWGWLILGEPMQWAYGAALLLVLIGLILHNRYKPAEEPTGGPGGLGDGEEAASPETADEVRSRS